MKHDIVFTKIDEALAELENESNSRIKSIIITKLEEVLLWRSKQLEMKKASGGLNDITDGTH